MVDHRELAWDELLQWLLRSGLTVRASVFDEEPRGGSPFDPADRVWVGLPTHRAEARTRKELKEIQDRANSVASAATDSSRWNAIWSELRDPNAALRSLDIARIPADAIAFYRGFHFEPFDQWGIYIVLPRLLDYCSALKASLGSLKSFESSIVMSLVLFDVFHHEFFHHLVECSATSIEVLCPSPDNKPSPIYLKYRRRTWKLALGTHPHDPVEEALANAYAYNSFSFLSRVQGGFLAGLSRFYQKALVRAWKKEPPGYREASNYIGNSRLVGSRLLIERMLKTVNRSSDLPVGILVEAVFPRGHTAFWAKPDIPTYLVGTDAQLRQFLALVPAPNETYSSLFWPADTKRLDVYIKVQRQKQREANLQKRRSAKPKQMSLLDPE